MTCTLDRLTFSRCCEREHNAHRAASISGSDQITVEMCVQRRLACCVPGMSDSLEVKVLCTA